MAHYGVPGACSRTLTARDVAACTTLTDSVDAPQSSAHACVLTHERHKTRASRRRLASIFWEGQIAYPRDDDTRRQTLGAFEALDSVEMREHLIVQHPERSFERV